MTNEVYQHPAVARTIFSLYLRFFTFLFTAQAACFTKVSARPLNDYTHVARSIGQDGDGAGPSIPSSTWIPILVIAVVLIAVASVTCARRRLRRNLALVGEDAAMPSRTALNSGSQAAGAQGTTNTTSQTRRPRRPRRTPSQISTTSLPPYMKEPGEQELVIFRGRSDMEDAAMAMPVLDEHGEESLDRGPSQLSLYSPVPHDDIHHDIPLDRAESNDTLANPSMAHLMSTASRDMPLRRSVDVRSMDSTNNSQESSTSLLPPHQQQTLEDPRGEAPPYFEVVAFDGNDPQRSAVGGSGTSNLPQNDATSSPPADASQRPRQSRLSGFFSVFTSRAQPPAQQGSAPRNDPTHSRNLSAVSTAQSTHGRTASHGTSHSASGSISATPSAFRALTRSRSRNHMNSPSTISLDSISAPLTHTVTRSEFQIPKGGLTAEQIKLITSRDTFGRFGMPYGPDAVAFSASRLDMQPPPAFDSTSTPGPLQTDASPSESHSGESPASDSHSPSSAGTTEHQSNAETPTEQEGHDPAVSSVSDTHKPDSIQTHPESAPESSSPTETPVQPAEIPTVAGLYPPSSFKQSNAAPDSRASSAMSFISAVETAASSQDLDDRTDNAELEPPTPTARTPSGHHLQDKNTDVTIPTITNSPPDSAVSAS